MMARAHPVFRFGGRGGPFGISLLTRRVVDKEFLKSTKSLKLFTIFADMELEANEKNSLKVNEEKYL